MWQRAALLFSGRYQMQIAQGKPDGSIELGVGAYRG
jgi:hypothetical protein